MRPDKVCGTTEEEEEDEAAGGRGGDVGQRCDDDDDGEGNNVRSSWVGDEDAGVMLIMIVMVGVMITLMEMMISAMTVSWSPVLSVLLIIHPSNFCTRLSCAGSQEGWSFSQHALGER